MVKIEIDLEKCDGYGTCVDVCEFDVLEVRSGKSTVVNLDNCVECWSCETSCPTGAIKLVS